MAVELGVVSEKALRRAGLRDLLLRAGFEVRAFGSAPALREAGAEVLDRARAVVVDLETAESAPSQLLASVQEALPGVPRIPVGSALQISALEGGWELAPLEEEPSEVLVDGIRARLRARPPDGVVCGPGALGLTPRQRDVMSWIAGGADNLKIAVELGICERSVKAHVSALLRRLALENRTELALLAFRAGFRPPAR